MKSFRVLLLYPNGELMNPPPVSIGIFTAMLREKGFEVDLFDSTLYPDPDSQSSDGTKEQNLQVRPFDYGSRGVKLRKSSIEADLVRKVEEFRPNLIAISILECTYARALSMLKAIEGFEVPIIAGGVFATHAPEIVLTNRNISMLCIGEGEGALGEVCERLAGGEDCVDIENLWVVREGHVIRNRLRRPVDINTQLVPDYSLFEEERFLRPMAGKVYRTVPVETNRGCPYSCSFCNSPSTSGLYKENGFKFFRRKKLSKIRDELESLIKRWDAEYVYFTSDDFLASSEAKFDEFVEVYKGIGLPFWMQSRPEHITRRKAEKLKEIGCHRMSLGLEHGNPEFRREVLNKKFDNETMVKASEILAEVGIPLTVNNIIGFPDETRELVFDTIELNRRLKFDTANCAVFAPFHGTPLQKLCVEKGYVSDDFIFGSINVDVPLNMPQLSREEIRGLRRTFALYARMPKEYWPKIRIAEGFDQAGNDMFAELRRVYQDMYFA